MDFLLLGNQLGLSGSELLSHIVPLKSLVLIQGLLQTSSLVLSIIIDSVIIWLVKVGTLILNAGRLAFGKVLRLQLDILRWPVVPVLGHPLSELDEGSVWRLVLPLKHFLADVLGHDHII